MTEVFAAMPGLDHPVLAETFAPVAPPAPPVSFEPPVALPAPVAAPAPVEMLEPVAPPAPVPPPAPVLEAETTEAADAETPAGLTWPCHSCSEKVSFELMNCPNCGSAFMGGAQANVSLKLPVVGDLAKMSQGARFGVMAGGAALCALVFVVLAVIFGHIF